MSTAKKGYNKEKLCRDSLKADGWSVVFKSVRFRFGCVDFAGLFDVVALKGEEWLFVSVKHLTNMDYYLPHQEAIREFKNIYGLNSMRFELWLWDKPRWIGRGINKKWHNSGWKIVVI